MKGSRIFLDIWISAKNRGKYKQIWSNDDKWPWSITALQIAEIIDYDDLSNGYVLQNWFIEY